MWLKNGIGGLDLGRAGAVQPELEDDLRLLGLALHAGLPRNRHALGAPGLVGHAVPPRLDAAPRRRAVGGQAFDASQLGPGGAEASPGRRR